MTRARRGRSCRCMHCDELFVTVDSLVAHCLGGHCLSATEMRREGWEQTPHGWRRSTSRSVIVLAEAITP
jgi:hypothetical protein